MTVPASGDALSRIAASFEEARGQALSAQAGRRKIAALIVAALALGALCVVLLARFDPVTSSVFAAVAAGLVVAWTRRPVAAFQREVKTAAFTALLAREGPGWSFDPDGAIDLAPFERARILPGHDRAKHRDVIRGRRGGMPLEIAELVLTERRGSGKNRRTVIVFRGVALRFDLGRPVRAHTVVLRRFGHPGLFTRLERVRLEDPVFEDAFNVFSEDQVAARVLLTTSFMERLLALSDDLARLGGNREARLTAAFREDRFLALVPCRTDLFEVRKIGDPAALRADLERLSTELSDVVGVADRLRVGA